MMKAGVSFGSSGVSRIASRRKYRASRWASAAYRLSAPRTTLYSVRALFGSPFSWKQRPYQAWAFQQIGLVSSFDMTLPKAAWASVTFFPLRQHLTHFGLAWVGLGLVEEVQGDVEFRLEAGVFSFFFSLSSALASSASSALAASLICGPASSNIALALAASGVISSAKSGFIRLGLRPALHDRDLGHVEFHFAGDWLVGVGRSTTFAFRRGPRCRG